MIRTLFKGALGLLFITMSTSSLAQMLPEARTIGQRCFVYLTDDVVVALDKIDVIRKGTSNLTYIHAGTQTVVDYGSTSSPALVDVLNHFNNECKKTQETATPVKPSPK